MAVKPEEIRKAKKFLENKNYSIKKIKPRLFAMVAKSLQINYTNLLNRFEKEVNGKISNSDKKEN